MLSDFAVKPLVQSSWSEICVISEIFYHEREKRSEIQDSVKAHREESSAARAYQELRGSCCEVERNSVAAESCAGGNRVGVLCVCSLRSLSKCSSGQSWFMDNQFQSVAKGES